MPNSQETNHYSKCIFLVCLEPKEENLNAYERLLLNNAKLKWHLHHDPSEDPENFSIIFVDQSDIDYLHSHATKSKYRALNHVDHHTRIYIVGHCDSGMNAIYSDPITHDKHPEHREHVYFSYQNLAKLILHHIDMGTSTALMPRPLPTDHWRAERFNSLERRLKICLTPCHTGSDKKNSNGSISKSFAEKFYHFLLNGLPDRWLNCDVVATKGDVYPVPTHAHFLDFLKMINFKRQSTIPNSTGFHKRYRMIDNHPYASFFPRHKPTNLNYKIMLTMPETTTAYEVDHHLIDISTLSYTEMQLRISNQHHAELILQDCIRIMKDPTIQSLQISHQANFIALGITTGEMSFETLKVAYSILTKALSLNNSISNAKPPVSTYNLRS